jgi:hypothetical protein
VRGRDLKQDEKILEQILRVLGDRKEVRIVKSDLIHKRRMDSALKADASKQSTEPALPADADKPRR